MKPYLWPSFLVVLAHLSMDFSVYLVIAAFLWPERLL